MLLGLGLILVGVFLGGWWRLLLGLGPLLVVIGLYHFGYGAIIEIEGDNQKPELESEITLEGVPAIGLGAYPFFCDKATRYRVWKGRGKTFHQR